MGPPPGILLISISQINRLRAALGVRRPAPGMGEKSAGQTTPLSRPGRREPGVRSWALLSERRQLVLRIAGICRPALSAQQCQMA
jgi:hypothetical protein